MWTSFVLFQLNCAQPNLLSTDGTASLATAAFSRGKGEYYAYGISLSVSNLLGYWLSFVN